CCRLKLHFYAKLFSHRATGKFGIFDSYSSVYWIGSVFFCTKSGLRGLNAYLRHIPGVATLARSTPGFILPPAPQAENMSAHFVEKFCQS
ncbi:MAG TPA: hypothetical protein VFV58_22080, partial [Blastocatellia bacterium]|nr:hypothetical protein [Blastocatellia bacterium]